MIAGVMGDLLPGFRVVLGSILDGSAALRCGSFSKGASTKCTCAVMIGIIITLADQIFL